MLEIHFSFVYVCMVEFDLRIFFNGNWCWKYILPNLNSNLNFINDYECEFAVLQTFKYVFFKTFIRVNKLPFQSHEKLPISEKHFKTADSV